MAKILDTEGLNRLGADVREMIGKVSVPTITIALDQVRGQNPLQIQLSQEQYDALAASQVAVVDATAVGVGALATIVRYAEDSGTFWFQGHNLPISNNTIGYEEKYSFLVNRSTKILTQYEGTFYAVLYVDADGWNPEDLDGSTPVSAIFVKNIVAASYAYATNITSGSTLPDDIIRLYITQHLPICINGALCQFLNYDASTNISRYFTATMNGALVHLNIIEINTSTWVVTFNQVDVGASPNVDQDLTTNTCFTLDATAFASLVSAHTATVALPDFTGLINAYEFVTIKASINGTNYNVKLCRNDTGKYSGLFFIEDSSHLYEVTVYYNGTSVYLRCATVY